MKNEFEILARFLERGGEGDVTGHILEAPPADVTEELRAFARGELDEAARAHVVRRLQENPQWIGLLAAEVQRLRER